MIYTIGDTESYTKAIAESDRGAICKIGKREPDPESYWFPDGYNGGVVFETLEDAERGIVEFGKQTVWSVWGLNADWKKDTYPAPDGWWHYLLIDIDIIPLR